MPSKIAAAGGHNLLMWNSSRPRPRMVDSQTPPADAGVRGKAGFCGEENPVTKPGSIFRSIPVFLAR